MKQLLITIAAVVLVGCGEPSSELLLQSVTDGNVEAVKQHLADGADVNVKDEARGLTPFALRNSKRSKGNSRTAHRRWCGCECENEQRHDPARLQRTNTAEQQQNRDRRHP